MPSTRNPKGKAHGAASCCLLSALPCPDGAECPVISVTFQPPLTIYPRPGARIYASLWRLGLSCDQRAVGLVTATLLEARTGIPSPRSDPDTAESTGGLWVPPGEQWLSRTSGRVAAEGYSWLQAVHWVAGSGLYEPRRHRSHGPRTFGRTTIRVAQELAQLFPCRPGIVYLVRRTGLSERSVEYHLGMLRESGLLAYIVRGNRVRGEAAQASEFARVIPAAFDVALGIRTVLRDEAAPAYTRAATGIAESGRTLMAKLGRKASRTIRKPRAKAPSKPPAERARKGVNRGGVTGVSGEPRCTPMQVGSSALSSAGDTSFPPESKLASGEKRSSAPKRSNSRRHRKLNHVGRRYQLAYELIQQVDWLNRCAVRPIAWVIKNVADAGWTADEVRGWLHLRGGANRVHRPSGLLAVLLNNAENVLDTPAKRAQAVSNWRDSSAAEQRRNQEVAGEWPAPRSRAVQRLVAEAITRAATHRGAGVEQRPEFTHLEEPNAEDLAALREEAWGEFMAGETALVMSAIDVSGRSAAERVYGAELVQRVLRLAGGTSLMSLKCG